MVSDGSVASASICALEPSPGLQLRRRSKLFELERGRVRSCSSNLSHTDAFRQQRCARRMHVWALLAQAWVFYPGQVEYDGKHHPESLRVVAAGRLLRRRRPRRRHHVRARPGALLDDLPQFKEEAAESMLSFSNFGVTFVDCTEITDAFMRAFAMWASNHRVLQMLGGVHALEGRRQLHEDGGVHHGGRAGDGAAAPPRTSRRGGARSKEEFAMDPHPTAAGGRRRTALDGGRGDRHRLLDQLRAHGVQHERVLVPRQHLLRDVPLPNSNNAGRRSSTPSASSTPRNGAISRGRRRPLRCSRSSCARRRAQQFHVDACRLIEAAAASTCRRRWRRRAPRRRTTCPRCCGCATGARGTTGRRSRRGREYVSVCRRYVHRSICVASAKMAVTCDLAGRPHDLDPCVAAPLRAHRRRALP